MCYKHSYGQRFELIDIKYRRLNVFVIVLFQIQFTHWQNAILKQMYEAGMNSTASRCEALIVEASRRTNLPISVVKVSNVYRINIEFCSRFHIKMYYMLMLK